MRKQIKKAVGVLLAVVLVVSSCLAASAYTAPVQDGVESILADGYSAVPNC